MKFFLSISLFWSLICFADDYNMVLENHDFAIKGNHPIIIGNQTNYVPNTSGNLTSYVSSDEGSNLPDQVFESSTDDSGKINRISEYFPVNNEFNRYRATTSAFKNGTLSSSTICVGPANDKIPCLTASTASCDKLQALALPSKTPSDLENMTKAKECSSRLSALLSINSYYLADNPVVKTEADELSAFAKRHAPQFAMTLTGKTIKSINFRPMTGADTSNIDLDEQIQIASRIIKLCQRMKHPIPSTSGSTNGNSATHF